MGSQEVTDQGHQVEKRGWKTGKHLGRSMASPALHLQSYTEQERALA